MACINVHVASAAGNENIRSHNSILVEMSLEELEKSRCTTTIELSS